MTTTDAGAETVVSKVKPYDLVTSDVGFAAVDIGLVFVDVGVRIVCSDDELVLAAPGDVVDTRFVERDCALKADNEVRLPSVVVLDDEEITVAGIWTESVTTIAVFVFGSVTVIACVAIDSVTVMYSGVRDSVMDIGDVVRDSVTGRIDVV